VQHFNYPSLILLPFYVLFVSLTAFEQVALDILMKYEETFLLVLNKEFQSAYYVVHYMDGTWPEDNLDKEGLSIEESQKLRNALENVISKSDFKKLRDKLRDMEQKIAGIAEN